MTPDERPRRWRPWILLCCLWGAFFLAYISRQSLFSIFPVLRSQLDFSEVQLALTGTVFLWIYALGNPIAGHLSDRFSKIKLIIWSLVLWSLCVLLMGTSRSPMELLTWRGILAFAQALYIPAAIALIVRAHSDYTRSTALSIHGMAQFMGVVAGAWYGGFVAEWLSWRWMLWMLAIVGLLYAPVLYLGLKNTTKTAAKAVESRQPQTPGDSSLGMLMRPSYATFCFCFFAMNSMLWMIYTWLPDFLRSKFDLSLAAAGFTATAYVQLAMIAGLFTGAPLGDNLMKLTRRGRVYVMLIGLAACSPFLHWVGEADSLAYVKLAAIGYGYFTGVFVSNFLAALTDIIPRERHGFGIGFCNMVGALAGGLAALLVGTLKEEVPLETLFSLAALMGIVAALLLSVVLFRYFLKDYIRAHPELSHSDLKEVPPQT